MIWFIAGMLFAFLGAITMLINQKYKLDGHLISGMRGVGVGLLFMPAVFLVEVPQSPLFWGLVLFEAVISTFFNARLYASSAIYGAGSTSRISVMAIAFGLVFWWILDYKRFIALWDTPLAFWGIIGSLAIVGVGFVMMHISSLKGSNKTGELAFMMPAVIVLAVMMINRKEIMEHAEFWSATTYYCFVAILLSGVFNLIIYAAKNSFSALVQNLSKMNILEVGLFMSLASAATIFFGNMSSLYVPDPAYINAITLTSPVWIMIIDKFFSVPDKVSIPSVVVMFAGLATLIYFSSIPVK